MSTRILQIVAVVLLVLIVLPFVAHAVPPAVGADQSYVVLSGSMEPNIGTGSVVYVTDAGPEDIEEGDVITFVTSSTGPPTTHRVVSKTGSGEDANFVTKGDANEDPDAEVREPDEIIGEVIFSIPYIGYVIAFAGTPKGTILFITVPAALFIMNEAWYLWKAATTEGG